MTKEGAPLQKSLLFMGPVRPAPPVEPARGEGAGATEAASNGSAPAVRPAAVERPQPTVREARAIRSLLYNRLLLEAVQRRIEKAEAIILSYLLTQEGACAQIGPYWVEVDADGRIGLTKTADDNGWSQLYFPEVEEFSRT